MCDTIVVVNTFSYQTFEVDAYAVAKEVASIATELIGDISVVHILDKGNGKADVTIQVAEVATTTTNIFTVTPITLDSDAAIVTDQTVKDNVTFHGAVFVPLVRLGGKTLGVLICAVVETGTDDLKYSTQKHTIDPDVDDITGAVTTILAIVHTETVLNRQFGHFATAEPNGKAEVIQLFVTLD